MKPNPRNRQRANERATPNASFLRWRLIRNKVSSAEYFFRFRKFSSRPGHMSVTQSTVVAKESAVGAKESAAGATQTQKALWKGLAGR